jgi:hypothetical protein
MDGKKTYSFLAGVVVSAAAGYATRHGVDLGPITPDLTDVLVALFSAGAVWARSVVKTQPAPVPVVDKQNRTVRDILKDQK